MELLISLRNFINILKINVYLSLFIIYITRMRRLTLVLFAILLAFLSSVAGKTPNPYKVLGVQQTATEEDIKTAFKKRSRKYHPDINKEDPKAKEKFEKVVNAYELLKDPERRRMYDMTGEDDPQQQQFQQGGGFPGGFGGFGGGGINIEDLMRSGFFGGHPGGHPGGHQGGRQGQQRQRTYTFSFGGGNGMRF